MERVRHECWELESLGVLEATLSQEDLEAPSAFKTHNEISRVRARGSKAEHIRLGLGEQAFTYFHPLTYSLYVPIVLLSHDLQNGQELYKTPRPGDGYK